MFRWNAWVKQHPVEYVEFDIAGDREAFANVLSWTGHASVPTLVIAEDDSFEPVHPPKSLPDKRSPRGADRGTMLSEPNPGQIAAFLRRHHIPFGGDGGSGDAPEATQIIRVGNHRPWWKIW